ncbi:MAG: hypothetical protein PHV74_07560 [Dehalococcoidia bacterium]|nr:hypothetical protein [Dehalococcoidia bacterium]
MKKIIILLLTSILISILVSACDGNDGLGPQDNTHTPAQVEDTPLTEEEIYANLLARAEGLAEAYVSGDYMEAISFMYPRIVDMAGGSNDVAESLKQAIKEDQLAFLAMSAEDPMEIIESGERLFVIVPIVMEAQDLDGTMLIRSFQIGVSEDGGNQWWFMDSTGIGPNREMFILMFGDRIDQLEIPEPELLESY